MERAHRHYRDHCADGSCSHLRLLLTYCVENGLKVLLMKDRRVETYSDLPENYRVHHDLAMALTLLHAPPELHVLGRLSIETRHQKPPQERVHPKDLHQTFRYGIPISSDHQVVAELQKILGWIGERLT